MSDNLSHRNRLEKFSRKFAQFISSGVPLVKSLSIIVEESDDELLNTVIRHVNDQVKLGRVLSDSMSDFPDFFSRSYIGMVRAGEGQGILDEMMKRIADGLKEGIIEPERGNPTMRQPPNPTELKTDPMVEVTQLVNRLIHTAIERNASDIHIIPTNDDVLVQLRVHGVLETYERLRKDLQVPITMRIKIMSHLDLAEKRLPQDGRIMIKVAEKTHDLRVALLPIIFGEKITLRIISSDNIRLKPEDIFNDEEDRRQFEALVDLPYGLILTCGPTGSGKTTTLYSALNRVNNGKVSIATVEDPIEYVFQGVTQVRIMPKIGLTFPAAIRSILRSDPDVIMIGEIRDEETLALGVKAAVTGHLVLSQLHALDTQDAIKRLMHMDVPGYLVSSALAGIVAQRLVRRVCPDCARKITITPDVLSQFGPRVPEIKEVPEAVGCEKCMNSGYRGRLAIYEIFRPGKAFKDALLSGNLERVMGVMEGEQRRTLRQSGLSLVGKGLTTLAEVWRVTGDHF